MPETFTAEKAALLLPVPATDAHKYSRGCLTIVGGSTRYQGAAVLAALAACRVGAGYTRLATPKPAAKAARSHLISVPVEEMADEAGCFCKKSLADVERSLTKADAVLVGPGMGMSECTEEFLWGFLASDSVAKLPLILDADALNIIAGNRERFLGLRPHKPQVLTPHEGEAARLLGHKIADREASARELACSWECVAILKGPQTLIAAPDGRVAVCTNAGPELAKAGSGDVLAGIVSGLKAQGLDCMDAACLGVYLHGMAGALAAGDKGVISVIPEDVVDNVSQAILSLQGLNRSLAAAQLDAETRAQAL